MASGIFALLDDIAALMDDVAVMSKVAAKKTAGILGDDLAVNAEKASGFVSDREIPVLWAITKGSFLNKLIILPFAFLLSAFLPAAVTVILVLGGLYLAYEGAEKIYEYIVPHKHAKVVALAEGLTKEQILLIEKEKVKSAIVTDFILSVEIVIIALGTVVGTPLVSQVMVVSLIAILATVGVYGIVALIVRMDEFGYKLIAFNKKENSFSDKIGKMLVAALPKIIKSMGFIGTVALILVSGGIFVHNIDFLHHLFPALPVFVRELVAGLTIGFIVFAIVALGKRIFNIYLFLAGIVFTSPALAQDSIPVTIKGKLTAGINNETSGLAASSVNKGLLYIHNDSGDSSRFFLIEANGTLKAIYIFKANPLIRHGVTDCEDIAVSTGPKRKSYVYIGDIGDNSAKRKHIIIYRLKEPKLGRSAGIFTGTVKAEPFYLKYPDGPRDAETLMVDPVEKLFYIISKREDSVNVYTAPLLFKRNDTVTLVKRATLFFEGDNSGKWICGGDIAADGSAVLVKNYLKVFYWKRKGGEPVWKLLMTPPREIPYKVEQQGEAIGFTTDSKGYYTISEGEHPEVYYYSIE